MKISIQFAVTVVGLIASVLLVQLSSSSTEVKDQVDYFISKNKGKFGKKKVKFNKDSDQKDAVNKMTNFTDEIETAVSAVVNSVDSGRSYEAGYQPNHYSVPGPYAVDFSPLFLALIPIALFLGAAAAFALSVATSSSTAVATAQQQQQQEESSNNNNAANNNNNNALLAALVAAYTNNNQKTIIVVNNATGILPFIGRRSFNQNFQLNSFRPKSDRRRHRAQP